MPGWRFPGIGFEVVQPLFNCVVDGKYIFVPSAIEYPRLRIQPLHRRMQFGYHRASSRLLAVGGSRLETYAASSFEWLGAG